MMQDLSNQKCYLPVYILVFGRGGGGGGVFDDTQLRRNARPQTALMLRNVYSSTKSCLKHVLSVYATCRVYAKCWTIAEPRRALHKDEPSRCSTKTVMLRLQMSRHTELACGVMVRRIFRVASPQCSTFDKRYYCTVLASPTGDNFISSHVQHVKKKATPPRRHTHGAQEHVARYTWGVPYLRTVHSTTVVYTPHEEEKYTTTANVSASTY